MAYIFKLKINKEKFPPTSRGGQEGGSLSADWREPLAENLSLLRDDEEVASVEWLEGRDMGKRLFEAITELLEKNNLKPKDVGDFVINSEVPENYTSARIAETVKRAYVFGVKNLQ